MKERGTTVGNDAIEQSSRIIGVVKEAGKAGKAWPRERKAGEEGEKSVFGSWMLFLLQSWKIGFAFKIG